MAKDSAVFWLAPITALFLMGAMLWAQMFAPRIQRAPFDVTLTRSAAAPVEPWSQPPPSGPIQPGEPSVDASAVMLDLGLPSAPKPVRRVVPGYPEGAVKAKAEGVAVLIVSIDERGRVESAKVAAESPSGYGFGDSTQKAVLKWKFAPADSGLYQLSMKFQME